MLTPRGPWKRLLGGHSAGVHKGLLFGKHQETPHSLHSYAVSTAASLWGWVTATCHPLRVALNLMYKPQTPPRPGARGYTRAHTQLPDALEDTILGTVTKQQLGYPYSLCSLSEAPGPHQPPAPP